MSPESGTLLGVALSGVSSDGDLAVVLSGLTVGTVGTVDPSRCGGRF